MNIRCKAVCRGIDVHVPVLAQEVLLHSRNIVLHWHTTTAAVKVNGDKLKMKEKILYTVTRIYKIQS